MAKKRMFSLGVLDTDAFLDMPLSAQALYFHLNLRADDDGFVGNPKRITQNVGANLDDLKLLVAKRFVITFDDGVIVIKHWRMHNAIKKDRYTETNFVDDLKMLDIKENGSYTLRSTNGAQVEHEWSTNGAQVEHEWSSNGAQMSQTSSTGIGIGLGLDIGLEKGIGLEEGKEKDKGGVGETHTGSSKRTSKVEKNLKMLQTIGSEYGFDDFVYEKLTEWMKYKGEIGFVYKEQGAKSFFTQTKKSLEKYGADAVVSAIDTAIASGWKGFYPEKTNQTVSGGIDWSRV